VPRILGLRLAALTAATLVTATPAPAHASATGSTPISSFSYSIGGVTIAIPNGCFFTHRISGDGQRIDAENAGTDCVGPGFWSAGFCNWRINFEYFNTDNQWYGTNQGDLNSACNFSTFRTDTRSHRLPGPGRACAVFMVNGAERARQCHSILR
jgi:hypothetical protein